jgi:hypothetical protein
MGEISDSGRNHGLDGSANNVIRPNESSGNLELISQIAKQGSFWANSGPLATSLYVVKPWDRCPSYVIVF